jgi:hypothetical protein
MSPYPEMRRNEVKGFDIYKKNTTYVGYVLVGEGR